MIFKIVDKNSLFYILAHRKQTISNKFLCNGLRPIALINTI